MDLDKILAPYINGQLITLWTIHELSAWQNFQKKGFISGDGRRIDHYFRSAYDWMLNQMKKRITDYPDKYPIWAWYFPKPDLRKAAYLPKGTKGVRIECQVSAQRVLLSDFETWHNVLNDCYLALAEKEDEKWEKQAAKNKQSKNIQLIQQAKEKSWEKIFNLKALESQADKNWLGSIQNIQATLEKIYLSEVKKVTIFTAK